MKPKFRFTLTELTVLALIGCAVISICGYFGYYAWHNNMAISLSEDASFVIGTADLTSEIQYQTVTNSFTLGFIFTILGGAGGFAISTALNIFYTAVKLFVAAVRKIKFDRKNKEIKNKGDKKHGKQKRRKSKSKGKLDQ